MARPMKTDERRNCWISCFCFLWFYQKYLNLSYEKERMNEGLMGHLRVSNWWQNFIFGWTIPLIDKWSKPNCVSFDFVCFIGLSNQDILSYCFIDMGLFNMRQFCHGPAGVPRLATRCLCVLSTWLVVCLVPCAPMSIVCPLPSCYLIIVSVAPAVSPSLPSFVSLYSLLVSAVLCWSVVFRVSHVSFMLTVLQSSACLPACLLVFPLRGGFCCSFVSFYY